jgi:hypothetical protein
VPGTVTEPAPGTLVWTPSEALPPGTYGGAVGHVSSTGAASVPIDKPYTFTFTVS